MGRNRDKHAGLRCGRELGLVPGLEGRGAFRVGWKQKGARGPTLCQSPLCGDIRGQTRQDREAPGSPEYSQNKCRLREGLKARTGCRGLGGGAWQCRGQRKGFTKALGLDQQHGLAAWPGVLGDGAAAPTLPPPVSDLLAVTVSGIHGGLAAGHS